LDRQLSVTEQNSPGAHAVSSGTYMQRPAKHTFCVQLTWSSQSASSQHSAHSPSQQRLPEHLLAQAQLPSVVQKSVVQVSPSSQLSGPAHCAAPPEPPEPPVAGAVPWNASPPHAATARRDPKTRKVVRARVWSGERMRRVRG
jgi:hypothetical protein